jgi:hypothetical protein
VLGDPTLLLLSRSSELNALHSGPSSINRVSST